MSNQFEDLGDRSVAGTTVLAQATGQRMLDEIHSPPGSKQAVVSGEGAPGDTVGKGGTTRPVTGEVAGDDKGSGNGTRPITGDSTIPRGGGHDSTSPLTGEGTDKFINGDSYKPRSGDGVVQPVTGDNTGKGKLTGDQSDRGQGKWTPITGEQPRQGQTPWLPDIKIDDPTPPNTHPHDFYLLTDPGDRSQRPGSTTAPGETLLRPLSSQ